MIQFKTTVLKKVGVFLFAFVTNDNETTGLGVCLVVIFVINIWNDEVQRFLTQEAVPGGGGTEAVQRIWLILVYHRKVSVPKLG